MKSVLAIATIAIMAISAPAFAQSAGTAGATGDKGPLTGHNTPGSGVDNGMTAAPSDGMQDGTRMNEGRAAAPNAPNAAGIDQKSIAPGNTTGGGGNGAGGNGAAGTGGAAK